MDRRTDRHRGGQGDGQTHSCTLLQSGTRTQCKLIDINTNRRTDRQTEKDRSRKTGKCTDGQIDIEKDRSRKTGKCTDGQIDIEKDRQMDRQTVVHSYSLMYRYIDTGHIDRHKKQMDR
jgi:hypothetical protein